jgi:hypothetical protein
MRHNVLDNLMRKTLRIILLPGLCLLSLGGCKQHPLTDYRPIDQAGMWSSNVEQLKTLNTTDTEVAQLVRLKKAGVTDETCLALISISHQHQHPFTSTDATLNLFGAGYTEEQVLEIARTDQIDVISGEAVTLKLIGLSEPTVQYIFQRRLQHIPTMGSAQISRLKNTGLTEKQILERIKEGMTDAQAEKEIALREATRNHSNTGFVRVRGRKPR